MSRSRRLIFFLVSSGLLSLVVVMRLSILPSGMYSQSDMQRIAYAKDPSWSDQLCRQDVAKAKRDIKEGKVVFTQKFSFGTRPYRFEEELINLCQSHGLTFDIELISDFSTGETQGCYADYMDGIINERFGREFKGKLLEQADSLFIKNTILDKRLVESWYCDEAPYLTNKAHQKNDVNFSLFVSDIPFEKDSTDNKWPHLDLSFIIEQDSSVGNFSIAYYAPSTERNKQFEQVFFERGIEYIKTIHPIWVPGTVADVPVRTGHNVRIFFIQE